MGGPAQTALGVHCIAPNAAILDEALLTVTFLPY